MHAGLGLPCRCTALGQVETAKDFSAVVWKSMNDDGWKLALSRTLQDAGYEID